MHPVSLLLSSGGSVRGPVRTDDAALHDAATDLLYTGITRGRKLVILVGERKAVGMAVKGKVETRRWSKLAEWMAQRMRG
jgi:hypothetical protein